MCRVSQRNGGSIVSRSRNLVVVMALAWSWAFSLVPPVHCDLPRILVWVESLQNTEELEIRRPVALASGANDELVVADVHSPRLIVCRRIGVTWQLQRAIELPSAPIALVHDGRRYIASLRGRGDLLSFEGIDKMQQTLISLPEGTLPGQLAAEITGSLLVFDLAREKLLRVDTQGRVQKELPLGAGLTALASTPGGGFVITNAGEGSVQWFGPDWQPGGRWVLPSEGPVPAWPVGIAVEPNGSLDIVDRHGGRILVIDATGKPEGAGSRRGWESGLLLFPAAIDRLGNGNLVVADEGNGRVQIFRRVDGIQPP